MASSWRTFATQRSAEKLYGVAGPVSHLWPALVRTRIGIFVLAMIGYFLRYQFPVHSCRCRLLDSSRTMTSSWRRPFMRRLLIALLQMTRSQLCVRALDALRAHGLRAELAFTISGRT